MIHRNPPIRREPAGKTPGLGRWPSLVSALVLMAAPALCGAVDKAQINAAVGKAAVQLRAQFAQIQSGGLQALAAMALLKAQIPADSQEIRAAVDGIRAKTAGGAYRPTYAHIYEAGVDASLLAELEEGAPYHAELTAIADYILERQLPAGGWDYPKDAVNFRGSGGDISVTQYACLGLWAAQRSGVEVPGDSWSRVLTWLLKCQNQDGGYSYVPGTTEGFLRGESDYNMTFAGLGSVLIATLHLHPDRFESIYLELLPGQQLSANENRVGVLKKLDLSGKASRSLQGIENAPAVDEIQRALRRGRDWIEPRFRAFNDTRPDFQYYYYYCVERFASLANVQLIGRNNWYNECAEEMLKRQLPDGGWASRQLTVGAVNDTAFAILFLMRSTGKILRRSQDVTVGGGLLTGGKGDPGEARQETRTLTPLDKLLASLQDPDAVDLEEVQEQLVEQVQIGDRRELIGQKDTLVRLVKHPTADVRRTAVWALGRTNDLSLARYLVDGLEDADIGVMIEAHAALAWLSRKFDGFGLPVNPLDELPEGAAEEVRQAAIEVWRASARRAWGNWYLQVRPYAERGDEFEADLRQRLGDLKSKG